MRSFKLLKWSDAKIISNPAQRPSSLTSKKKKKRRRKNQYSFFRSTGKRKKKGRKNPKTKKGPEENGPAPTHCRRNGKTGSTTDFYVDRHSVLVIPTGGNLPILYGRSQSLRRARPGMKWPMTLRHSTHQVTDSFRPSVLIHPLAKTCLVAQLSDLDFRFAHLCFYFSVSIFDSFPFRLRSFISYVSLSVSLPTFSLCSLILCRYLCFLNSRPSIHFWQTKQHTE